MSRSSFAPAQTPQPAGTPGKSAPAPRPTMAQPTTAPRPVMAPPRGANVGGPRGGMMVR